MMIALGGVKIRLDSRAAYLPSGICVISDLHVGLEQAHRGAEQLFASQDALLAHTLSTLGGADELIIAGDVLDDFSLRDRSGAKRFLDALKSRIKVTLVRGNHDTMLSSLVECVQYAVRDEVLIVHGDVSLPKAGHRCVIMGHEHPAVRIFDGIRSEIFSCYLVSDDVLVLPAFHPDITGTPLDAFRSPVLEGRDISAARVLICENGVHDFGFVSDCTT